MTDEEREGMAAELAENLCCVLSDYVRERQDAVANLIMLHALTSALGWVLEQAHADLMDALCEKARADLAQVIETAKTPLSELNAKARRRSFKIVPPE